MKKIILALFIFIECFICNTSFATDTLDLKSPISLEKIGREYAPKYLLIENSFFRIPFSRDNGFFNNVLYSHDKFSQVYFRNCKFGVYETSDRISNVRTNSGFYVIDSSNVIHLPINNTTGNVNITSSTLNTFSVENSNDLRLSLTNDSSISFIMLSNNKNLEFQLNECAFNDSGEVRIFNSSFSQFDFLYNKKSSCHVLFQNDTINYFGAIDITDDKDLLNYKIWYKHENVFTFYKCHINAPFDFFNRIPNSTFIFNNCTFGENAYLGDMAADKLVIKNCRIFPQQIEIGFREKNNEVKLELENSVLENIRLDFSPNIKLVFDSLANKDAITNSYKNLLEKFEHEGKDRSFEVVDLQYRKFTDSYFFHFINSIWWYHGYIPGLVFVWASALLLIFFLFNSIYWFQMFEIYKLEEKEKVSYYKHSKNKLRFYSMILLYTCFIFFSLRVDLNKLRLKNLKFVYAFLFQYLVGIWCMIFIVRFIFKL